MWEKRIQIKNKSNREEIRMNRIFLISNIKHNGAEHQNGWYFSGEYSKYGNHLFFFSGTLYELKKSEEQYFEEFTVSPVQFVRDRKGDFIIWDYDTEKDVLFFATDRMGKDNIYYYDSENILILTNDFWTGASLLPRDENCVNWLAVKELIIQYTILFHKTIIKGYDIVPPAVYGCVSESTGHRMAFTKYWEMKFTPCETSLQKTAEKVYSLFDSTFKLLAEKYDTDTRFGVGLSGGWDSRLIVAFAQKYGLNIVPYCIGEKYLFWPVKTNGYQVSRRLAKYFNLNNFVFVEYNSESYLKKAIREVELTPDKASNMEIGCLDCLPDFDIMLNGEHGGVFLGEFRFEDFLDYDLDNLDECLLNMLSVPKNIKMIMDVNDIREIQQETRDYIASLGMDKRQEIYYRYFFEIKGSKSKKGFFETNYGTKERYTMYLDPNFVDEYLTWDPLFLVNRTLQRTFFRKYFEELSKLPDETTDAPLFWRDIDIRNVPIRFLYGVKNYVLKSSLRREKWIKRDKDFSRLLHSVYKQNLELIQRHFPEMKLEKFYKENPRATANFVKMIMVVDALLCKKEDRSGYLFDKYS